MNLNRATLLLGGLLLLPSPTYAQLSQCKAEDLKIGYSQCSRVTKNRTGN